MPRSRLSWSLASTTAWWELPYAMIPTFAPAPVPVPVAREAPQPLQILLPQHLAAPQGRLRVRERVGHPAVHAEVEVGEHEHRGLEGLGEVEGVDAHGEALLDRAREEDDVLRVAVGQERGGEDVALGGAGGEPGRWADALHVE